MIKFKVKEFIYLILYLSLFIMVEIYLKNIRCYSYHGCLNEESVIGSEYLVNLWVKGFLGESAQSDELKDAIDYVVLNKIVKEEMSVASKLLEAVAKRILTRILKEDNRVKEVSVMVSKLSPPINGDVESVSIKLSQKR